jgi:hypothetical protein
VGRDVVIQEGAWVASNATILGLAVIGREILNGEQYDLVVFLGVIYHLRHPLLALDDVRRLTAWRRLRRVRDL